MKSRVDLIVDKFIANTATEEDVKNLKFWAEEGDEEAILQAAICMYNGHLCEKNEEKAMVYFEKLLDSNNVKVLDEASSFLFNFDDKEKLAQKLLYKALNIKIQKKIVEML